MKQEVTQAMREIKVTTKRFSLRKGVMKIFFSCTREKGQVKQLFLKQRNVMEPQYFPFELRCKEKGQEYLYEAELDVNQYQMEIAFWDVVARVEDAAESYEAILGGLSAKLKIKLILFPRWTRTQDGHLLYPFVNGARQFTIQYRKYDKRYDSYCFLMKEYLALFCYFILKPYWDSKKLWLVCEKFSAMAQDNGLYFFKYCMEQLPEEEKKRILYVMDKEAPDYAAVQKYDKNVIQFMSFRYMIYLSAAEYLISSDAIRHFYIWDSPNSVYKVLYQIRKNIVFLQHGVMAFKQCHRIFRKSGGNRMALFVVSSEFEQDIIHKYFEYDRDEIIITGLPRWDVLKDTSRPERKEILLMPTWRGWLEDVSEEVFKQSDYYKNYEAFLNSDELRSVLEENEITLNFYIHPKFREYIGQFHTENPHIRLIPFGQQPLNELLMSCHMLITDYSSVAWDVYYQEKPVIFYPFDLKVYEEKQGSYIDMEQEAFGDVVHKQEELFASITKYIQNGFKEELCHAQRRDYLLPLRDDKNSERIYNQIKKAKLGKKFSLKGKL